MGAISDSTMTSDFTIALCKGLKKSSLYEGLSRDDMADLRHEYRRPRTYSCSDGMCGALDCVRCHPEGEEEEAEEEVDKADLVKHALPVFAETVEGKEALGKASRTVQANPDNLDVVKQAIKLVLPVVQKWYKEYETSSSVPWSDVLENYFDDELLNFV